MFRIQRYISLLSIKTIPSRQFNFGIQKRLKSSDITIKWKKDKIPSKRVGKYYKLKNHKGAVARWMIVGNNQFKRSKCARNHLNRKQRPLTRKAKKNRVLANQQQRRLLKKLIPYFKKKYFK
jgi:ribosomal protein L35